MEAAMRMIIEARIVSHTGTGKVISLADIERVDGDLKQLGPNLTEGRDLMHDVQHALVNAQTNTFLEASVIASTVAQSTMNLTNLLGVVEHSCRK
jgi:hypothetical protein